MDVPHSTELIHRMNVAGCKRLPNGVLKEEACVDAVEVPLKEKA